MVIDKVTGVVTFENPAEEIAYLRQQNAALQAKAGAKTVEKLSLRVSEKKALSVYGLGRFPVTLYKSQWARLLGIADEIRAFIKANDANLADKPANS